MVVTAKEARRYGIELVEYLYPLRDLPKGIDPEPRWCSASSARKAPSRSPPSAPPARAA